MRQRYVDALCREMLQRRPTLARQDDGGAADTIATIYLGGGTPSQLTVGQLRQLFDAIYNIYKVYDAAEVTIECNPDDVTDELATALPLMGVNRVSMGAQTFDDGRLRLLHRRHTARQVGEAVERLRRSGISNISIDLMYGLPGQSPADWQHDIDAALQLGAPHLSAYCLMVEEGTELFEQMRREKSAMRTGNEEMRNDTDSGQGEAEETERQMYDMLIDRLTAAGYEHYEISNFARPGYRSRHNQSYWQDTSYIGLGAAAHSYDSGKTAGAPPCRSWNVSNLVSYIEAIESGRRPCEQEVIDADTHYNDLVATALRTSDGLDLTMLSERHRRYCTKEAHRFVADGLVRNEGDRLVLTRRGLFVSDMVMSALVYV